MRAYNAANLSEQIKFNHVWQRVSGKYDGEKMFDVPKLLYRKKGLDFKNYSKFHAEIVGGVGCIESRRIVGYARCE